jgi:hypothetical protein
MMRPRATEKRLRDALHLLVTVAPQYDCFGREFGLKESDEWREAKETARKLLGIGETPWIPRK